MHTPHHTTTPTNLYSILLKLRPIQPGTLMAYSGEPVHGAWLNWPFIVE